VLLQIQQAIATHPHPHEELPWERKCSRAILRLAQQFPNDPGAMAPLFLNYLLIAPGESFFMAANEPHACAYRGANTSPVAHALSDKIGFRCGRGDHRVYGVQRQCGEGRAHPEVQGRG
jgi:hypothetical protein